MTGSTVGGILLSMDAKLEKTIDDIAVNLSSELDKIGLYTVDRSTSVICPPDMGEVTDDDIIEGRTLVLIDVTTTIGDLAWEKRTLDPLTDELERKMDEEEFFTEGETLAKSIEEEINDGWEDF